MFSDYHVHSIFSFDSEESPMAIVEKAIALGMKQICFTDHQDFNWPIEGESPYIDFSKYFEVLNSLRNEYSSKINILKGVELGLTSDNFSLCHKLLYSYDFDFVIGSCHIVDRMDPYYAEFWEGKNDRDCFELYFKTLLDSLKYFIGRNTCTTPRTVNTLGHLDYIVRYSPNKDNNYSVADYIDVIDEILKMIIENDIKLEINTSNFSKGFDFPNPHTDIIRRYKELGGLYVTVGSDAHKAQFIGSGFDLVEKIVEKYKLKVFTI
ncbi:histidinol-phosphatase HisJ family protein [Eubacterium ventriosum]|uniref:histidinol-phosphatase HisJ family protein n=1 Tax=Eubacterium ventriosum TaxID=39496 RepID=UPI003999D3C0